MFYIHPTFLEKKPRPKNPFHKVICEEIGFIDEALGSFDGQQKIADQIASRVVMMWENNETTTQQAIAMNGETIPLEIEIERTDSLMGYTRAEIDALGHRGNNETVFTGLKIKVILSQFDAFSLRGNELKNKLLPIISHELMHGNMFSLRLAKGDEIDLVPWYETVVKIIGNERDGVPKDFAYSMYACYFYERQAIISSTYTQLLEKFNEDRRDFIRRKADGMDKESAYGYALKLYKKELMETEAYQTYSTVSHLCKNMSKEDISFTEDVFKKYGYAINAGKEADRMALISEEALKDVSRNGSLFFHEVLLPLIDKNDK